jgi:16S rRNA (guanine966-N2)-methyltransferase
VRTRPTSDKVREAIFAILGPPAPRTEVLDLYAGTGALGIEALSRGASHATFVESARPVAHIIEQNLRNFGLGSRSDVVVADALAFVRRATSRPWTWIFIDPPYQSTAAADTLEALARSPQALHATVVIEHDRRHAPPEVAGPLRRSDSRRYGDTLLSFYRPAIGETP